MRKGFTLIEVLVVIAILPFAMMALSRVFAIFIRDIPRMTRVVEQNTTVLDMVGQLREDVDAAVGFPDAFAARRTDGDTLLIERQGDVVCYQAEAGAVERTVLGRTGPPEVRDVRTWTFPDAAVSWLPWQQEGTPGAVEVRTLVRQRVGTKLKDKMVNTYVFFVGGRGKDGGSG